MSEHPATIADSGLAGAPVYPAPRGSALLARWLSLVGLFAAELIFIGLSFDGEVLEQHSGVWARLLGHVSHAVAAGLAVVAATLLIGGRKTWAEIASSCQIIDDRYRWQFWLLAHLLSWSLMFIVTAQLFSPLGDLPPQASWLSIAWFALAFTTTACWGFALLPARGWRRWCLGQPRRLLAGTALGIAAWAAAAGVGHFGWNVLGAATLRLVHALLTLIYRDVVYEPLTSVIGTPSFQVTVSAACAGYEGIGLITVFLTGYLWLSRRRLRFPQALILLPVGAMLIWVANLFRIVLLIAIGSAGWPGVARGGFHSQAGWLAFNAVALMLAAFASRWRAIGAPIASCPNPTKPDGTTAYLAPFLGLLATAMVTGAVADHIDWFHGLRVFVAVAIFAWFFPQYGALQWPSCWRPLALGFAGFALWVALAPSGSDADPLPFGPLRSAPAWCATLWWSGRLLGYFVAAPLVEELAFRGFLLRRFASADFDAVQFNQIGWWPYLASSVLFGAMHGAWWLPATAAGICFAFATRGPGRIADAVAAHATTNVCVAAYACATANWDLWG